MNFDNIEGLSENEIILLYEKITLMSYENAACIRSYAAGQFCQFYYYYDTCSTIQSRVNWAYIDACYYSNSASSQCADYNTGGCRYR